MFTLTIWGDLTMQNHSFYNKTTKTSNLSSEIIREKFLRVKKIGYNLIIRTRHYVHQDIRLFKIEKQLQSMLMKAIQRELKVKKVA